mmetsp:Transcript_13981/g.25472  ORF Transcript_13981/g.25472 Transcript_13981/m.25472 type:complete len:297 (+) Transcript_13981:971-1861(+)
MCTWTMLMQMIPRRCWRKHPIWRLVSPVPRMESSWNTLSRVCRRGLSLDVPICLTMTHQPFRACDLALTMTLLVARSVAILSFQMLDSIFAFLPRQERRQCRVSFVKPLQIRPSRFRMILHTTLTMAYMVPSTISCLITPLSVLASFGMQFLPNIKLSKLSRAKEKMHSVPLRWLRKRRLLTTKRSTPRLCLDLHATQWMCSVEEYSYQRWISEIGCTFRTWERTLRRRRVLSMAFLPRRHFMCVVSPRSTFRGLLPRYELVPMPLPQVMKRRRRKHDRHDYDLRKECTRLGTKWR